MSWYALDDIGVRCEKWGKLFNCEMESYLAAFIKKRVIVWWELGLFNSGGIPRNLACSKSILHLTDPRPVPCYQFQSFTYQRDIFCLSALPFSTINIFWRTPHLRHHTHFCSRKLEKTVQKMYHKSIFMLCGIDADAFSSPCREELRDPCEDGRMRQTTVPMTLATRWLEAEFGMWNDSKRTSMCHFNVQETVPGDTPTCSLSIYGCDMRCKSV